MTEPASDTAHRLTVSVGRLATADLEEVMELLECDKTTAVRRGIRLLRVAAHAARHDGYVIVKESADAEPYRVVLL